MAALANTTHTLASNVAHEGTVVVGYPEGHDQDSLNGTADGSVSVDDGAFGTWPQAAGGVAFTFGASNITITNNSGVTWPAGSVIIAGFGETTIDGSYNLRTPRAIQDAHDA